MIDLPITPASPHAVPDAKRVPSPDTLRASSPAGAMDANESGFGDSVPSGFGTDWSPSQLLPDRLMDYAVRMVTQMRREFGRALDVPHFLYNAQYAKEIIALALTSKDARLRAYATFLDMQMFSPRQTASAGAPRRSESSAPEARRTS